MVYNVFRQSGIAEFIRPEGSLIPISHFGQLPAPDAPKEKGVNHGNLYGVIICLP